MKGRSTKTVPPSWLPTKLNGALIVWVPLAEPGVLVQRGSRQQSMKMLYLMPRGHKDGWTRIIPICHSFPDTGSWKRVLLE